MFCSVASHSKGSLLTQDLNVCFSHSTDSYATLRNALTLLYPGASVSISTVIETLEAHAGKHHAYQVFAEHLKRVASVQIRSVGSWAGNVTPASLPQLFSDSLPQLFSDCLPQLLCIYLPCCLYLCLPRAVYFCCCFWFFALTSSFWLTGSLYSISHKLTSRATSGDALSTK